MSPGARRVVRYACVLLALIVLTLLTQVGGVIVGATLLVVKRLTAWPGWVGWASGLLAYAFVSWSLLPALASLSGRVPLPCAADAGPLRPQSPLYCALNRHYLRKDARAALQELAGRFESADGRPLRYLDAGFPFGLGFPMLPHLSHGTGRRVDLSFVYQRDGKPVDTSGSRLGYFAYLQPQRGSLQPCATSAGWLSWDLDGLQPLLAIDAQVDGAATAGLIKLLAADRRVSRLFLEPHLQQRWSISHDKVRFQGCDAARHDDHIHVDF